MSRENSGSKVPEWHAWATNHLFVVLINKLIKFVGEMVHYFKPKGALCITMLI